MSTHEVLIEILARVERKVDDGFTRINGSIGQLQSRTDTLEKWRVALDSTMALKSQYEDKIESKKDAARDNLTYPIIVNLAALVIGGIISHFLHL